MAELRAEVLPEREQERLKLRRVVDVLDAPGGEVFDRVTRLLASALEVPVAMVCLVDRDQPSFTGRYGLDCESLSREVIFCAETLLDDQLVVIADVGEDLRYREHPLRRCAPQIRFYAGAPIASAEGRLIGALCAADTRVRQLSAQQLRTLVDLSEVLRRELLHREAMVLGRRDLGETAASEQRSRARLGSVFQHAAMGIAIVAPNGTWIDVNPALCAIVGYPEAELLRLSFEDITHPDDIRTDRELAQRLRAGEIDRYAIEKRFQRRDGKAVWASLTVALRRQADGAPDYFVCLVEDIQARKSAESELHALYRNLEIRVDQRTRQLREANQELSRAIVERSRVERSLRDSEALFRAVLENAYDAFVSTDSSGRILAWNQQAQATFGWSVDEALGNDLDALIFPRATREECSARLGLFEHGPDLPSRCVELLAQRRDGSQFPLEIRAFSIQLGQQFRFCAFMHDVTTRRRAEHALQSNEALLRAVADNMPVMIASLDRDLVVRFANQQHRTAMGWAPEAMIGRRIDTLLSPQLCAQALPSLHDALEGHNVSVELHDHAADGSIRHLLAAFVPHWVQQRVEGVHVMVQDITERRASEMRKEVEARQDALTGLPNRRALFERLPKAMAAARDELRSLAVLFIDLNGFKSINDDYGHDAGDKLLRQVGSRMQASLDTGDWLARLAGDEFVVIADCGPGAASQAQRQADQVAERISASLAAPFDLGYVCVRISASVGSILSTPDVAQTADSLLRQADAAMYAEKHARRRARGSTPAG
jgi:diguanylate cyclase (GGDEF)-like protein/PAS domain S-box-containing protein